MNYKVPAQIAYEEWTSCTDCRTIHVLFPAEGRGRPARTETMDVPEDCFVKDILEKACSLDSKEWELQADLPDRTTSSIGSHVHLRGGERFTLVSIPQEKTPEQVDLSGRLEKSEEDRRD